MRMNDRLNRRRRRKRRSRKKARNSTTVFVKPYGISQVNSQQFFCVKTFNRAIGLLHTYLNCFALLFTHSANVSDMKKPHAQFTNETL